MAGHYFYDPRPFYGHNGNNGLLPLDELFYGRYEPIPYWMDQRMAPVSAVDDYYLGHKQMAMGRGLPQLQQYAYKRPESQDDIGVDMYKRSPYNFNGVAGPMVYGGQQQRQSHDDTWVHAMTSHGPGAQHGNMTRTSNGNDQYQQMEAPMGYMPTSNMNGNRGMEMPMNNGHMSNKGSNMGNKGSNMSNMGNNGSNMSNMGNNSSNYGSHGTKQMSVSSNQFGNKNNGYDNGSNGFGNGYNNGHGEKSMNSKQGGKTNQRYIGDDFNSDDSDDDYENNNNNGMKWATKNSIKHGNGHQKTGSKSSNHGYDSISSQHMSSKKSGGHGGSNSGGNHGSTQSKISKMLRFQVDGGDSSSSDSEDEGYGHSKKSSKGSSKMGSQHGSHGNVLNYGHQQSKQMQYGSSQSKGVELKVPICCDNCERKVRECLQYMDGVENVLCDQWNRKVTVYGNVKADNVLKRVRKVKKASELWQQAKQQQQLRVY